MLNTPCPSVTAVRTFSIRAGLDASTVTPGSTAPEESFTTPVIDACANTADGRSTRRPTTSAARSIRIENSFCPAGSRPRVHAFRQGGATILYGCGRGGLRKNLSNLTEFDEFRGHP